MIRRTLSFILLLFTAFALSAKPVAAQELDPDKIAEQAYASYAAGNWNDAVTGYSRLLQMGYQNVDIYYNLGTAYAQLEDNGRAIAMLIRARRIAPRDADIRANLRILSPEVDEQLAVFPAPPIEILYSRFTQNEWAWTAALFTILTCLFAAAFFMLKAESRTRPLLRKSALICLVIAVPTHGFAWVKYANEEKKNISIVIAENARPRERPNEDAATYESTLPAGTVIEVFPAGTTGWIRAEYGGRTKFYLPANQVMKL